MIDLLLRDYLAQELKKNKTSSQLAEGFYHIEFYQNEKAPYWDVKQYEEHFKSDDNIYTNAEKTAFVFYRITANELEVTHWAVKQKGRGEGRVFFSNFLSSQRSKASKVILECGEWNVAALKLYQSLLFEKNGFRPGYYRSGEGAWLLERNFSG